MRKIQIILLLFISFSAFPQKLAENTWWFWLKDKEGSVFSVDHPESFLSERSINRRAYQGLAIDERDLPVSERYLDSLRSKGIIIKYVSRWLNAVAVELPVGIVPGTVAAYSYISSYPWSPDPGILYYPPKPGKQRFSEAAPDQGQFSYGEARDQVTQISLDQLHSRGYTGKGVYIALLDAGFDRADILPAFDSLFVTDRILYTRDFVDPGSTVYANHTHGMMVLSIIGGNIPDTLIGTAPYASFILARTENGYSEKKIEEAAWIAGAEWADSLGADVINSSLGYYLFDDPVMDYSYEYMDGKSTLADRAASLLADRGIVLCNSAGNEGNNDWHYIITPADATDILAVGAVGSDGQIASFSSRGLSYDNRIKPDVCAMGYQTAIQRTDTTVGRGNGTSFSSPVIAGATACLWQLYPELPAKELVRNIARTGDRANFPDLDYGFGIPDFSSMLTNFGMKNINTPGMFIFPNPCRDGFQYSLPENQSSELIDVNIYNTQGQMIMSIYNHEGAYISLPENTQSGLYLIEINTTGNRYTGRLIVQ